MPETDKLLKLSVNLGSVHTETSQNKEERDIRQIISGIAPYFPDLETLVGKKCMFVANLEPRVIRGLQSQGMILAVATKDGKFSLLEPKGDIYPGARAK